MIRMHELTPAERCEVLSRRLTRRPRGKPDRKGSAMATMRRRRKRLELERPRWILLIRDHHGKTRPIARHIGSDVRTVKRAIWDLGLWPVLVSERARLRSTCAS